MLAAPAQAACATIAPHSNAVRCERYATREDARAGAAHCAGSAASVLLRLDRAGRALLRRRCTAGIGGRDLLGLRRAADAAFRLVADPAFGGGVARRRGRR